MSLSLAEAQRLLDKSNLYKDKIDGIWGPNTERAVNSVLSSHSSWYDEDAVRNNKRKYISASQILLKIAGYYTDRIDGISGRNTRSAYDNWYHDVFPVNITPTVKFPCGGTTNLMRFYGPVGKNQTRIDLPFTMKLAWDKSVSISRMTLHEKIAGSALRAFDKIADHYSSEDITRHGFNLFGGSLNVRKMRGGSSWSTHCLPKDSPVWTPFGVRNIQDINVGDFVYSYDNGNLVEKKVINFFSNGYKKLVTVNLNGGQFQCSSEHKIAIIKKEKIRYNKANYFVDYIEAKDLKKGDKVVNLQKKILNENFKIDLWHVILGMFIGDGCVHHRKGIPSHVSFSIPKEDRIRHFAEEILYKFFGKENVKKSDRFLFLYKKDCWSLFLKYDKPSYEKEIPTEIWSSTLNEKLSFILGYLYTDGTLAKSTQYRFKCASKKLMKDLRLLLSTLGFKNTRLHEEKENKNHYILGVKCYRKKSYHFGSRDVNQLLKKLEHDEMYQKRLENSVKPNSNSSRCQGYETIAPDFVYKSVKSIEFHDILVPVYDIEVEDTHNFIVDGNVVSNSWGIAIDFDPERNRLRWNSSRAYLARPECEMFWKIWEEEGWTSLGRWKNYDWMHVQATRRC